VAPSIDARDLSPDTFPGHLFDRVVFNFPYTGSEDETSNGDLLRKLFRNLRPILRFDAEVHLRLCNSQDETWSVIPLITSCGFRVVARLPFSMSEFPGYERRKLESDIDWPMGQAITLISMLDEWASPRAESLKFGSPSLPELPIPSPHFGFPSPRRVQLDNRSDIFLPSSSHSHQPIPAPLPEWAVPLRVEKRPRDSFDGWALEAPPPPPRRLNPPLARRPVVVKRSSASPTKKQRTIPNVVANQGSKEIIIIE